MLLIVLHHGLWGGPHHIQRIIEYIQTYNPDTEIAFLNIKSSQGSLTYDGIDVCGDRATTEILDFIESNPNIDKISFIGYSLGGLILRFAIGKLGSKGIFKTIKPIQYISMATPHLGSNQPNEFLSSRIFNRLQQTLFVRVGAQLTLTDEFIDRLPLLVILSHPQYCFQKYLKMFKMRACFANVRNDRTVKYTTASISPSNPYKKFDAKVIDQEYPSIVTVDYETAVIPVQTSYSALAIRAVVIPILLPIWLTVASVILTTTAIGAKLREPTLPNEKQWIKQTNETNISPTNPNQIYADDLTRAYRHEIIEFLNRLEWKKVDVLLSAWNAHGSIVLRRAVNKELYEDVLIYLAKQVLVLE